MKYDYSVVGAGLFGAVFANLMTRKNKKCLVLDKRNHIGGNCYTTKIEGIDVHCYGAHIFRTSNKDIWKFVNDFDEFNNFINSPVAKYKDRLYNLPFNMNTFYQIWGCTTPEQAIQIIQQQRKEVKGIPTNLEEKAISLVGRDVYEILIKGYTEKQWGRDCKDLPASIIRRLPFRLTFDNNYFNDRYQGIPEHGYTYMISKMLEGSDIQLETDFCKEERYYRTVAKDIVYTGALDELFDYEYGALEYRSLEFRNELYNLENVQGVAVMNYTERNIPYTRTIEHKHFVFGQQKKSILTFEYPKDWRVGDDPYYPINDDNNQSKYKSYAERAKNEKNLYVGGRLGEYRYYDMQDTIASAFKLVDMIRNC